MSKRATETVVGEERRAVQRVKISRPMLVRPSEPKYKEEVQRSVNASRNGVYFTTRAKHYHVGMPLSVTLGYAANDPCNSQSFGNVVRVDWLKDGSFGIAVQIRVR